MKKALMFAVSVLFFVAISSSFTLAQEKSNMKSSVKSVPEAGTKEAAQELFKVARLTKVGKNISSQLIQLQKKKMPDIPSQFWSDFSKEIDIRALNESIVQLYITNLTVKEMKEITAFYKTETGQTFLNKLPLLSKETMNAGRKWGMDLRMQITKRLQEVDLKSMKK